jgi:plasmid replication initiation protein
VEVIEMALKGTELVQKRNVINEIRANNMTMQELRFFSIYLSKINKSDISTRVVRFPMADFQKIMELGRLNISHLKATTNSLLSKVVNVPSGTGGYTGFQLFKRCKVDKDEKSDEWYVEIDAHDEALPLMFDFKNKFFSYRLWNALRLRSANQLRMYEILKQYEGKGERIIEVKELRELLGIGKGEYPRWDNFKSRVLDGCQTALEEHTDIKFTYELHGRRGKGGKILALRFIISKNTEFVDQLTLEEFIDLQPEPDGDVIELEADVADSDMSSRYRERIELLRETAVQNQFSFEKTEELNGLISDVYMSDLDACNYLMKMYRKMAAMPDVRTPYTYLRSIVEKDLAQ